MTRAVAVLLACLSAVGPAPWAAAYGWPRWRPPVCRPCPPVVTCIVVPPACVVSDAEGTTTSPSMSDREAEALPAGEIEPPAAPDVAAQPMPRSEMTPEQRALAEEPAREPAPEPTPVPLEPEPATVEPEATPVVPEPAVEPEPATVMPEPLEPEPAVPAPNTPVEDAFQDPPTTPLGDRYQQSTTPAPTVTEPEAAPGIETPASEPPAATLDPAAAAPGVPAPSISSSNPFAAPGISTPSAEVAPSAESAEAVPTTPDAAPFNTTPPAVAPETSPPRTPEATTPETTTPETTTPETTPPAEEEEDIFGVTHSRRVLDEPGGWASFESREWNDAAGRHSCEARLIGMTHAGVVLLRTDGLETPVAYRDLSDQDLEFVQRQIRARKVQFSAEASLVGGAGQ
jgi:hypothetical protein